MLNIIETDRVKTIFTELFLRIVVHHNGTNYVLIYFDEPIGQLDQ